MLHRGFLKGIPAVSRSPCRSSAALHAGAANHHIPAKRADVKWCAASYMSDVLKGGVRTKTWTTKEVVHVFLRRQTSSG
ncbi:hypothetical protein AGR2A_pa30048 [Agrobacterium genomosp. 2 str. CFBP 5494]|uniref:Uncharacterized protein n=1 Tax=Agrobacterium genomosp. 2 str. CFBP 5494 TaxID=1183436 RepID=A0A9W5B719_9HYPH|nr:hypothetical protein AGR2A_pa30048 [Agrobacterium genomosp. 2 str. CFBP 5494]